MEEKPEETEHFRMRLDDLDEEIDRRAVSSEVNELRLEKISQRVTMISIMIPVLIVIVLVITYLDIKKRVVQTEDSGTIEFRKLSSDLESRFSSLSLRQAKLEDTLEKLTEQNDRTMASIQVRMEKLNDSIEQIRKDALGVKELDAVKQDLLKQINNVIASTNEATKQNTAMLQDLKSQVIQQTEKQAAMTTRIADAQKNYADLESRKIDKQSLDLALRLEALKVETAVKTQVDGLQQKLNALERQLSQLSSRATPATPTPARPAPAPVAPTPAPAAPAAPSGTPSPPGNDLETHTITPR